MIRQEQHETFTLIYNSTPISISKFRFALYSAKFREIPEFLTSDSLAITGSAPLAVFNEFIKGAQGDPIEIKDEYILDLLTLCEEWQTQTLKDIIVNVIKQKPDYNNICDRISRLQKESLPSSSLEEILANNLNTAINLPAFQNFPLEVVARILNNPDVVVDAHLLYKFIMAMFAKYGSEASILAPALDIRKLTAEEAQNFLSSPHLVKSFMNDSLVPMTIQIMNENQELHKRIDHTEDLIKTLFAKLGSLENKMSGEFTPSYQSPPPPAYTPPPINSNIDTGSNPELINRVINLERAADSNNQALNNLQSQFIAQQKAMKDQLDEIEKKAHRDVRKTNRIVNGLTRKAAGYDDFIKDYQIEQEKAKEGINEMTKLCKSLQNEMIDLKTKMKAIKTVDCQFRGRPFNGIFRHLSEEAKKNAHVAGIVDISASTSDHNEPYQIIDMGWDDLFFTENKPNQWIQFDFKQQSVKLDHYTIKTHKFPNNTPHLKHWVIEGSNDQEAWEEIDKRLISVLHGKNKFQTFPVKNSDGTYRYIRLREAGLNFKGNNVLALTNFELFGQIFMPQE